MPAPRHLIEQYRKARYRVLGPRAFELRVGEPSPACDALLAQERCASAALLTAWNPRSEPRPETENAASQATLVAELAGRRWFEAEGSGDGWPPEPSLLVAGLGRSEAAVLAARFRQHAFLYCETGRPVELVLTERA